MISNQVTVRFRMQSFYPDSVTVGLISGMSAYVDDVIETKLKERVTQKQGNMAFLGGHDEQESTIGKVASKVTGLCDREWVKVDEVLTQFTTCFDVETQVETLASLPLLSKYMEYAVVGALREVVDTRDYYPYHGLDISWLAPNLTSTSIGIEFSLDHRPRTLTGVEDRVFQQATRLFLLQARPMAETDSSVKLMALTHQSVDRKLQNVTATAVARHHYHKQRRLLQLQEEVDVLQVHAVFLGESPTNTTVSMYQETILSSINGDKESFLHGFDTTSEEGLLFESVYDVQAYRVMEDTPAISAPVGPGELFKPVVYKKLNFIDTTKTAISMGALAAFILLGGLFAAIKIRQHRRRNESPSDLPIQPML